MKTFASLLFPVSILMCLSSCSTFIYIGKIHDPERILDKKPDKIVFVNIFDYTSLAYVKEKHEVSYHAGVMKFEEGLSSYSKDEFFHFIIGDTLKKGNEAGLLTALLPTDTVRSLCNRYKADMLLSLDSMNIFIDWELIVDEDYQGNRTKSKDFYLYTIFYVSLYSSAGNLIDRSKVDKSSFYKSRPALSGLITIKPSIANARTMVETVAFQAGQYYVARFYPQIVQELRVINMGKPFKESNSSMKAGDWNRAIEILEKLAISPDPKIAKKAKQNLSVAKEAAGGKNN